MGDRVLGMGFGVGVVLGMPEFTVHLFLENSLRQKLLGWWEWCVLVVFVGDWVGG